MVFRLFCAVNWINSTADTEAFPRWKSGNGGVRWCVGEEHSDSMKKGPTNRLKRLSCLLCVFIFGAAVSLRAVPAPAATPATGYGTATNRAVSPGQPAATNALPDPEGTPAPVSVDVAAIDKDRIVKLATAALIAEPVTITKFHSQYS